MKDLEITAGCFMRRDVRTLLNLLKFKGHLFDFLEAKRWFSSVFYLRGLDDAGFSQVMAITKTINGKEK